MSDTLPVTRMTPATAPRKSMSRETVFKFKWVFDQQRPLAAQVEEAVADG